MEDVVIVGAGIAGLATAVALKRVGVRALVLEKSKGLRSTGTALTLTPNAWLALDALGVSHKLIPLYTPSFKGYVTNVSTGFKKSSSSLEDAVVLGRHIGNSVINNGGLIDPGDMAKAIDDYVKERKWRAAFLVTGSYLAGWVQLGGDKWWMKFLRDGILYKYLFGRISGLVHKACGKLPAMSFGDMDHSSKKD